MFWFLMSMFLLALLLQYDSVIDNVEEAEDARKRTWGYKLAILVNELIKDLESLMRSGAGKLKEFWKNRQEKKSDKKIVTDDMDVTGR